MSGSQRTPSSRLTIDAAGSQFLLAHRLLPRAPSRLTACYRGRKSLTTVEHRPSVYHRAGSTQMRRGRRAREQPNRVERGVGAHDAESMLTADLHDSAQTPGDDHGDDDALARGLLLESSETLDLASALVADQTARAILRGRAAELIALSEALPAPAPEGRASA